MVTTTLKHVLFVGPDCKNHSGGIGAVLETYSKFLKPFKFICSHRSGHPIKKTFIFLGALIRLLSKLTFDRDIKILHVHSASRASFLRKSIIILIGKLFNKHTVLHLHGGKFHLFYQQAGRVQQQYIRYILAASDVVICLSESWKEFFQSSFKIKRLMIVKNVVEEPGDNVSARITKPGINMLFLGTIIDRKGIFDLVDVLNENNTTLGEQLNLTIGGNGNVELLREKISKSKTGNIHYVGWVSGEKKNQLLRECDLFILPSYLEALPVSILEAMSYGKPIISTRVGGVPEIVTAGFNGWLYDPGDRGALSAILFDVVEHHEKLKAYGLNSLQVVKQYLPGPVFDALDRLYSELLQPPGSKSAKISRDSAYNSNSSRIDVQLK